MDQDTKVIQELQELKQKVGQLEDLLTQQQNKKEKAGPFRIFLEAVVSLLFGLIVVGPVIVIVVGVLMVAASWLGMEF
ncbi:CHASE3 domain sensor protein [Peribacillus simplex]|uniref:hypothetical protein n=1 Tax=Peribacillus simplex TaxID=1478 RepID=UPI0024E19FD9|nr:hypothetical protein [Peribacillus simplex]MDF9759955.1 CHASE3 domain sensor protein [Peribacillus simplex]